MPARQVIGLIEAAIPQNPSVFAAVRNGNLKRNTYTGERNAGFTRFGAQQPAQQLDQIHAVEPTSCSGVTLKGWASGIRTLCLKLGRYQA